MIVVNIHEAKTNLSALIQKALNGEEVVIAKNNDPIITLKPIPKKVQKRKAGTLAGKIHFKKNIELIDKEIEDLLLNSKLFPDE